MKPQDAVARGTEWETGRMDGSSHGTVGAAQAGPRLTLVHKASVAASFVAGYLLLDWVSYIHPMPGYNVTPWNPQPALAIALLMALGQRWLPLIFGAVVAAEYLVRGAGGSPVAPLLVAAVLSLGYAAIARALGSVWPVRPGLDARDDMARLVAVVAVGVLVTGLLYLGALFALGLGDREHAFDALLRFWIGDSVGILVTLPLLWIALDPRRRARMRAAIRQRETLAQGIAVGFALWFVFGRAAPEQFKFFYLLFLPLVWIAARHGMNGAAIAAAVIQVGVVIAVQATSYQPLTVFELQALLLALSITGFFLGATVDEERRVSEELAQSLRLAAAGEMAAALAHELNQPLTAVATYAKASRLLVEAPQADRELLAGTLTKLGDEARRAADVVRRLRDFFRSGSVRIEAVALDALIARVCDGFRERTDEHGVALRYIARAHAADTAIDPLQIEVVVRNLLANALDAVCTAADGHRAIEVELAVGRDGGALVSIVDSGPGVAAEDVERVFEPFVTGKTTGMGVGLAISRAIVQAHGGRLWMEAGAQGIVRFSLPRREVGNG